VIAGSDGGEVAVPAAVERVAGGRVLRAVWRNELGGLTFQVGAGRQRRFVKWTSPSNGVDLGREVARLTWAAAYHPVPRVLDFGTDEHGSWMVTAGLPGETAVADRWRANPAAAVTAIGEGLRALHDALPVDRCPFTWSVEDRLGRLVEPPPPLPAPPVDRLVVCHGDTCSPNTLIGDDGRWCGHVDLGDLGVADRWADLAVATYSLKWNYGPGWEGRLLEAYGIEPDPERTHYYRLLWDAG
jgi:kanamycin kinase